MKMSEEDLAQVNEVKIEPLTDSDLESIGGGSTGTQTGAVTNACPSTTGCPSQTGPGGGA
jgi:hypothetical protein